MRRKPQTNRNWPIFISFLIGYVLSIAPLPAAAIYYRPAWVLLILTYWLIALPEKVGIVIAWLVGLVLDLLLGVALGTHALIFTVLAYVILKFRHSMRGLSFGQKLLLIAVAETISVLVQYLEVSHWGSGIDFWRYWLPVIPTTLCWPLVVVVLQRYHIAVPGAAFEKIRFIVKR